jgi:hypothetical protein
LGRKASSRRRDTVLTLCRVPPAQALAGPLALLQLALVLVSTVVTVRVANMLVSLHDPAHTPTSAMGVVRKTLGRVGLATSAAGGLAAPTHAPLFVSLQTHAPPMEHARLPVGQGVDEVGPKGIYA